MNNRAGNDMFKNGEIDEVIELFERTSSHLPYTGGGLEKESRDNWKRRLYYTNGATNDQFLAFLSGYSAGKAVS